MINPNNLTLLNAITLLINPFVVGLWAIRGVIILISLPAYLIYAKYGFKGKISEKGFRGT
ncbi:MAG: hypothetical protein ACOC44_17030 [Promethearchaeia archaeon]